MEAIEVSWPKTSDAIARAAEETACDYLQFGFLDGCYAAAA